MENEDVGAAAEMVAESVADGVTMLDMDMPLPGMMSADDFRRAVGLKPKANQRVVTEMQVGSRGGCCDDSDNGEGEVTVEMMDRTLEATMLAHADREIYWFSLSVYSRPQGA